MDFKKIEWIFFVAFLGLNIFLFTIYHEAEREENSVLHSSQTESIEQRLSEDEITYEGKLSSEKEQGYYLSAEQTDMTEEMRKSGTQVPSKQLKGDLSITDNVLTNYPGNTTYIDENHIEKDLENFQKDPQNVLYGSDYHYQPHFSSVSGDELAIDASLEYEGIPFQDDTAQLEITLDKVSGSRLKIEKYTQTHLSQIEELREKMELYSEKDAVRTLYINNKIPSGSKILWRQLAYTRMLKVREKNVYVPVWFVAVETTDQTKQIESVNALNNTIITNNLVPKVENH